MTSSQHDTITPEKIELTYEQLHEEIEKLANSERLTLDAFDLWSGIHPDFGSVLIVLPSIGNGILIKPFVTQL